MPMPKQLRNKLNNIHDKKSGVEFKKDLMLMLGKKFEVKKIVVIEK